MHAVTGTTLWTDPEDPRPERPVIAANPRPDHPSGTQSKEVAMLNKTLFAAGLFGLALSASQPAFAGTQVVGYGDLDLSTKEGQSKLDNRLRTAAKQVCELDRPDLAQQEYESARQCFAKSLADARRARNDIRPRVATAR